MFLSARRVIGAMDKKWHLECFVCCECKTPFCDGTPFIEHEGKAYCPDDHGRLFGTKCAGCGKVISGGYVEQVISTCGCASSRGESS